LKSEKSQKAQSDNDDKFNTLLECAQKKIEAQIAQSQQIFEQVTNNFLERIVTAQQSAPTTSHDNEVTKQLVKEVVEESGGKWVDVVKKMGKQMDNFVNQGEDRERSTHSCCRNPNLAKCGGEAQHLEKLGIWSPPGLPNVQSSTIGPKTPRIGVFLVSLERS